MPRTNILSIKERHNSSVTWSFAFKWSLRKIILTVGPNLLQIALWRGCSSTEVKTRLNEWTKKWSCCGESHCSFRWPLVEVQIIVRWTTLRKKLLIFKSYLWFCQWLLGSTEAHSGQLPLQPDQQLSLCPSYYSLEIHAPVITRIFRRIPLLSCEKYHLVFRGARVTQQWEHSPPTNVA